MISFFFCSKMKRICFSQPFPPFIQILMYCVYKCMLSYLQHPSFGAAEAPHGQYRQQAAYTYIYKDSLLTHVLYYRIHKSIENF